MSAGTLSADQQAFRDALVAATGLDAGVVTAWIGAESGWGVTKATHNYLNVRDVSAGGWRSYASAQQAGAGAGSLLASSHYYGDVRAAIPAGPVAQVEAIQQSPWDANHYYGSRLLDTYKRVAGVKIEPAADLFGPFGGPHIPGTGSGPLNPLPDGVTQYVGGLFGSIGSAIAKDALTVGLTLVFTAAALGLIGFGVYRLSASTSAGRAAMDVAGKSQQVAQVAALAAV